MPEKRPPREPGWYTTAGLSPRYWTGTTWIEPASRGVSTKEPPQEKSSSWLGGMGLAPRDLVLPFVGAATAIGLVIPATWMFVAVGDPNAGAALGQVSDPLALLRSSLPGLVYPLLLAAVAFVLVAFRSRLNKRANLLLEEMQRDRQDWPGVRGTWRIASRWRGLTDIWSLTEFAESSIARRALSFYGLMYLFLMGASVFAGALYLSARSGVLPATIGTLLMASAALGAIRRRRRDLRTSSRGRARRGVAAGFYLVVFLVGALLTVFLSSPYPLVKLTFAGGDSAEVFLVRHDPSGTWFLSPSNTKLFGAPLLAGSVLDWVPEEPIAIIVCTSSGYSSNRGRCSTD